MSIIAETAELASPSPFGKLKLALKIAPFVLLAILLGVVLWQRNSLTDKSAKLEAASLQVKSLETTNAANQKTIDGFAQQRVDNDAIADAVAKRLDFNRVAERATTNAINEAIRNDPKVRNWADSPVPDSVRNAFDAPN